MDVFFLPMQKTLEWQVFDSNQNAMSKSLDKLQLDTEKPCKRIWDRNYLTLDCKTLSAIVEVTLRTWSCLEEQQRLRQEE